MSWLGEGIDPEVSAQGAFSHAFLSLQSFLIAVSVLMALYLAARTARGLLSRPASTTFDVVSLFLLYTCAQGAVVAVLLRVVPAAARCGHGSS